MVTQTLVSSQRIQQGTYRNVVKAIGNTPLIKLGELSKKLHTNIYVKTEGANPGLSAKDRIAAYIIEQAELKGLLRPGGTVVEATSGNTGFALAMICGLKGYRCVLTVADKASAEKINALKATPPAHLYKLPQRKKTGKKMMYLLSSAATTVANTSALSITTTG